jgi:hypothetical protein
VAVVKSRAGDFWSTYGRRQGIVRQPMEGKDVWHGIEPPRCSRAIDAHFSVDATGWASD